MTPAIDKPAPGVLRRVVGASVIGSIIEWYDFFLYGAAAAIVFNKLFFPQTDPLTGALLAFLTYAMGFLTRPLGGLVFGHFGDRIGRKKLLMVSLLLMGVSTCLIGLLPTYNQVGLLAPALLVLLRLVQGFAVGGEWGGAVLLVAEYGSAKHRGFWASLAQAGVPLGNLLAAAVLALLSAVQSDADFLAWGWRIPFILSAVLVAMGWWIRVAVEESPTFLAAKAAAGGREPGAPIMEAIRRRPGGLAIGAGLRFGENIVYYVITAFSIIYLTEVKGMDRGVALGGLFAASAVQAAVIPLFAALSDRIGRKPVYIFGTIGLAVWSIGFFKMLDTGLEPMILLAMCGGLMFQGAIYGTQAAFMSELFPTRYRYSGVSLAYQATSIFAGSLAPIISLSLFRATGATWPLVVYMVGSLSITLWAAIAAKETRGMTFAEIDARDEARP